MSRAAVIGDPIAHSLSPAIFAFLSKSCGQPDLNYEALLITPDKLKSFIEKARESYLGLNVTLPHKETILPFLGSLSEEARAVGAVNVVSFSGSGSGKTFEGHNTDVTGITRALSSAGVPIAGMKILLLGAGGAARAFSYAAGASGASDVFVLNQTFSRAEKLVRDFTPLFPKTRFHLLSSPSSASVSLAVNSTSLGMSGKENDSAHRFFSEILQRSRFEPEARAFDMIYTPELTPFLAVSRERGLRALGGLPMLIEQALATFRIWFGDQDISPETRDRLADFLRETLASRHKLRRIYLCGFMGSGKSTVAKVLAAKLGWKNIDTDRLIEQDSGTSVAEIFTRQGEDQFRDLETKAVSAAALEENAVVALGGGALNREENLQTILSTGKLIFLSASVDSLVKRLHTERKTRPLLQGLNETDTRARIVELLGKRAGSYSRAHLEIRTDGEGPDKTARRIIESLFKERRV